MEAILKMFVSSPVVRARVKGAIATASAVAGGWVLSHMLDWLEAHAAFLSHADAAALAGTVATCVAGLVLAGGTAAYNVFVDPTNVNAKIIAAAATGDPTVANSAPTVAAVKAAVKADAATPGTPAALDALVSKLSAGKT